jgi:hypothetical protein
MAGQQMQVSEQHIFGDVTNQDDSEVDGHDVTFL